MQDPRQPHQPTGYPGHGGPPQNGHAPIPPHGGAGHAQHGYPPPGPGYAPGYEAHGQQRPHGQYAPHGQRVRTPAEKELEKELIIAMAVASISWMFMMGLFGGIFGLWKTNDVKQRYRQLGMEPTGLATLSMIVSGLALATGLLMILYFVFIAFVFAAAAFA